MSKSFVRSGTSEKALEAMSTFRIDVDSAATEWSKYNSSVHMSIRMDPTAGNFTVNREFSHEGIVVSELDLSSRIEDRQI